MRSFLFVAARVFFWILVLILVMFIWRATTGSTPPDIFGLIIPITLITVIVKAASHVHRVGLLAERVDSSTLANRHRRRIEIPYPSAEAFDIVEASIRELPNLEMVDTARDSLQVRARALRRHKDAYFAKTGQTAVPSRAARNLVVATVTPAGATSSVSLVCEPEMAAWRDKLQVDQGTNLDNAEAITRAISRRIAEHRKGEESLVRESKTEKELTSPT
jgi:hypothetical protein